MTTLITGGNGKTGVHLSTLHHDSSKPFLITSRSGASSNPAFKAVKFDWSDPSTFENPFNAAKDIDKLYLISPPVLDPLTTVKAFLELAIQKGVKRVLFLSASDFERGDDRFPHIKIHDYLEEQKGIWYAVLRPTWFQENLRETFGSTIVSTNNIHTASSNGLIPFISAKDIAQAGYDALFAHENGQDSAWPRGRAPRVLGPELLTYDDVAATLSSVLGRKITHVHLKAGEPHPAWDNAHLPKPYQSLLELLEVWAAEGKEEELFTGKDVDKVIGKVTFKEYAESEKEGWIKK